MTTPTFTGPQADIIREAWLAGFAAMADQTDEFVAEMRLQTMALIHDLESTRRERDEARDALRQSKAWRRQAGDNIARMAEKIRALRGALQQAQRRLSGQ